MGLPMQKNYKTTKKAIRIISLSKYNAHTKPLCKGYSEITGAEIQL